jgi:hypothetical protein
MKAEGFSRALFITSSSVGIVFALGYPLRISIRKLPFPGGHIYSAVFWCVLLVAMVASRVRSRTGRRRLWEPVLQGIAAGYVSALAGYIALIISAGRFDYFLRKPLDIPLALLFVVTTGGWLLGGIVGLFQYLGECYLHRTT